MYHDMQMMIREDGGLIIPMFNNFLFGARDKIGGFVPAPVLTGLRCAEQLYFTPEDPPARDPPHVGPVETDRPAHCAGRAACSWSRS